VDFTGLVYTVQAQKDPEFVEVIVGARPGLAEDWSQLYWLTLCNVT
jgi:hypothetical protein